MSDGRDYTALVPALGPLKTMAVETLILLFHKVEKDKMPLGNPTGKS